MNWTGSDWNAWTTDWQAMGPDLPPPQEVSARIRARSHSSRRLRTAERTVTVGVAAAIALALGHAPTTRDLLLGVPVVLIVLAIGAVRQLGRSPSGSCTDTTAVFLAESTDRLRRRILCLRVIRALVGLALLFFVPWWIDGSRVHPDPSMVLVLLSAALPGAAMIAVVLWTMRLERDLRRESVRIRALGHRVVALLVLTLLFGGGCGPGAGTTTEGDASPPRAVAFVGVNVLPMTPGAAVRPDRTVLVRDGLVTEVGPRAEVRVPTDAVPVDGDGRYLMPGLADMHVHLEYFEDPALLALFLANGITTVRNMDGRPFILEWRERIAEGTLLGPRIHTAGPILDGDPPILDDNTVVHDAVEAADAVREQASSGYDFVKVYTGLSPEAYGAVLATARSVGLPVAGHVPRAVGILEAIRAGQRAIEHIPEYGELIESEDSPVRDRWHWSKLYLAMPVDSARMEEVARRVARSGVWTVPTPVQADRAVAPADSVRAWLAEPGMDLLPDDAPALWERQALERSRQLDEADRAILERGRRNRRALLGALHRAGADLLLGTDTPNPFVVPGHSMHRALASLVEAGLTPLEALAVATREAARFLGELDRSGTVEVGKRADLLLLEADPSDDIASTRDIAGVTVGGRWLPADRLGDLLDALREGG